MDILRSPDGSITFQTMVSVTVPAGTSMLEAEELLMVKVNEAGTTLTSLLLDARDAGPSSIQHDGRRFTAKHKKEVRHVETPYGCAVVWRRAFQSSLGGVCYYPMDKAACLIGAATPKFAQMVSRKLVELPAAEVVRDLRENHARKVTVDFVQQLTGLVGALAAVILPAPLAEGQDLPEPRTIKVISIGVDGACVLMNQRRAGAGDPDQRKERTRDWRTAMVGAITLHDTEQVRQGTIYAATAPPVEEVDETGEGTGKKGKAAFWATMEREMAAVKLHYPDAIYVGLSDGAADLLPWLAQHTSTQVLDYYHASGYVHGAAAAFRHEAVPKGEGADYWAQEACRHLRYDKEAAQTLLEAFEERLASSRALSPATREALQKTTTYFRNNVARMDYAAYEAAGFPLGSGVTEAGCKLLVKKRLCGPGMSWGFSMAGHILKLRALAHSAGGRWQSLWQEILTKPPLLAACRTWRLNPENLEIQVLLPFEDLFCWKTWILYQGFPGPPPRPPAWFAHGCPIPEH